MLSEIEQKSDTRMVIGFLRTNLKRLLLWGIAGGIVAAIITFFIDKQYRSYAVVFPPSSTAIENSIDYPNFGYDVEADRLMQILESREIRDSVILKFDLEKYYDADRSNKTWHDALIRKYSKDINFERTNSMAVIIHARNKNPEMAADIVNYIISAADRFREKLYKKNIFPAYDYAVREYKSQKDAVDVLEKKLTDELRENNLSGLLVLASDALITVNLEKLGNKSDGTGSTSIGTDIIAFKSMYKQLEETKSRMLKIKKTLENPIPVLFVVHNGEPLYRKVSPSYLVNALAGFLLASFVALLILLVSESRGLRRH
jgi:capsular polysaccharide biosynthesis protein